MKLVNIHTIEATLRCVSGLHIGGGDSEMHIGGIDNQVVRNPITQRPYIPGSSLKGKIRSLLEWRSGFVKPAPLNWSDYLKSESKEVLTILQLFGTAGSDKLKDDEALKVGPTRLSFWDCELCDDWRRAVEDENMLVTEAKSENTIDRISGTAGNPRYTERVTAGACFNFRLTVKTLDTDDKALLDMVFAGLRLLEVDSLGGSGSRGYGKVSFENLKLDGVDQTDAFRAVDPFKSAH